MSVRKVRPPVRDLLFQVYGRPLHPELFEILAEHRLRHEDYQLHIRITRTGHVISWENPHVFLTEVTASEGQPLPEKRLLLSHRLRFEQSRSLDCAFGVRYQMSSQVEVASETVFREFHNELVRDSHRDGLLYIFHQRDPMALPPLGYIRADALPHCLFLSCFHTFPEERTIIKSQTLIEKK